MKAGSPDEPAPRQSDPVVIFCMEGIMDADTLDRLVVQICVIGGLIALVWLPW
jgi:hypothetical protein